MAHALMALYVYVCFKKHPFCMSISADFFPTVLYLYTEALKSAHLHKRTCYNVETHFAGPGSLPGYRRRGELGGMDDGASDVSSVSGFSAYGQRAGEILSVLIIVHLVSMWISVPLR